VFALRGWFEGICRAYVHYTRENCVKAQQLVRRKDMFDEFLVLGLRLEDHYPTECDD
jgi:hypothetical protein